VDCFEETEFREKRECPDALLRTILGVPYHYLAVRFLSVALFTGLLIPGAVVVGF